MPFLCLALLGPLLAQQRRRPARTRGESRPRLAEPAPRWTVWLGGGSSISTHAVGFRGVTFASLQLGYRLHLPAPHSPLLGGHWEYEMEVPLLRIGGQPLTWALGISPIGFRYSLRPHGRFRLFLGGLGTVLLATEQLPAGTSRLNFSPQGEIGFDWGASRRPHLSLALRFLHISNAGLSHPNPGLNSVLLLIGLSFGG